ncbi:MAG TPA: alpha-L-fucosidase [Bryobacteraceae bacterium]|nr:alpha-L-fucosidase [Bryobacteraceae bacterium]
MDNGTGGFSRRRLIAGGAGLLAAGNAALGQKGSYSDGNFAGGPIAGSFRPNWESLKAYRYPDWFRDAKFGIWAHWSPQCVPEQGDWYARGMYVQGSSQYDYHVKTYGHPSQFGYKDICHLWHAENWNPEELIRLYAKTGARYFVALGNHHGNFDCWNSKHQPWNCVNVGPKKDIVGTWAKIARAHGLRFGITYHGTPGRTWREFMPVRYGSDKTGPLKDVPYDGVMTKADGKGKWWEGMDPQELNGRPHDKNDPCPEFVENFMLRVQDVIDQYNPDLLYFDDNCDWDFDQGGGAVWLGMPELTPHIMAYYYNANLRRNGGKLDAVFNIKNVPRPVLTTLVRDFEMSQAGAIEPSPWQTDTCIGGWHYSRSIFENHKYRTPESMVQLLVDVVSKNGNLLLNIPLPAHGRPDEDEFAFLDKFGAWMAMNKEAIYSTRPWKIAGEGPTKTGGSLYGGPGPRFVAGDFRFTTKGDSLYAIALAWPENGKLLIRSLASDSPPYRGEVASVGLVGSDSHLVWSRGAEGLTISLPEKRPCDYAYALKINPLNA